MKTYWYKIKTQEGASMTGTIVADSPTEAQDLLRAPDSFLIALRPLASWQKTVINPTAFSRRSLITLCENLAHLCRAGIPLSEALSLVGDAQTHRALHGAQRLLQQGFSLSQAFDKTGILTQPLLKTLLSQGETRGDYPWAFDQMAAHLTWTEAHLARLKKALAYPLLLLMASLGLMVFLLSFVVPHLITLYALSGLELSSSTQLLITLSEGLPTALSTLALLLSGSILVVMGLLLKTRHMPYTRQRLLKAFLKIPGLGEMSRHLLLLSYVKSLQSILNGQTQHILRAMTTSAHSLRPRLFQSLFHHAAQLVEYGTPLSQALKQSLDLPPTLEKILAIGEQSGNLPNALSHCLISLESDLERTLEKTLSRLGPCLLMLVGGLLIFIIATVFLPLYGGLGGLDT